MIYEIEVRFSRCHVCFLGERRRCLKRGEILIFLHHAPGVARSLAPLLLDNSKEVVAQFLIPWYRSGCGCTRRCLLHPSASRTHAAGRLKLSRPQNAKNRWVFLEINQGNSAFESAGVFIWIIWRQHQNDVRCFGWDTKFMQVECGAVHFCGWLCGNKSIFAHSTRKRRLQLSFYKSRYWFF